MSVHPGGFHIEAGLLPHARWPGRGDRLYALPALALALLAGCAPALNWREVSLRDGAKASFPCRPLGDERTLMLAGRSASLRLQVCEVDDVLWAVASARLADAGAAQGAQAEMQQALAANLAGTARVLPPATPGQQPARVAIEGRHPDGRPLSARAVFVSRGSNVFQFVIVARAGAELPGNGAQDYFFDSLNFGR